MLRPAGTALGVMLLATINDLRLTAEVATWWPMSWSIAWPISWPISWPIVAQLILAHLIVGFVAYWVHRSMHEVTRLWWFDSIHHDTRQVHVLKSGRFHFLDEIYSAIITPLPLLILGVPTEVVVLRSMWTVFNGSMSHANTPQRFPSWFHYVISTVAVHNLNHSTDRRYQDSNYAGTPIWDVLFGTFNHPDRCEPGEFGLADRYVPGNFFAQLLFPFKAQIISPVGPTSELEANR